MRALVVAPACLRLDQGISSLLFSALPKVALGKDVWWTGGIGKMVTVTVVQINGFRQP